MAYTGGAGDGGMGAPHTWPGVLESMDGLPFPELSDSRETLVQTPSGQQKRMVVMSTGEAFVLLDSLHASYNREVHMGWKGQFSDLIQVIPPHTLRLRAEVENPVQVAIKSSALSFLRTPNSENVFREIAVMMNLAAAPDETNGRDHVIQLVAACLSETHLHVITPFHSRGNLLMQVSPDVGIREPLVQMWFRQILTGVAYIHRQGFCHHDLSPENIVITGDESVAIVMDFGMVQRINWNGAGEVMPRLDPHVFGKMTYMAPEIFRRQEYDGRKIDIWSVGVMLLVCLAGEYPWEAPTMVPTLQLSFSAILRYNYLAQNGPAYLLRMMRLDSRLSGPVLDLLCTLLVVKPANRPSSATELANHPFFT
ncbi:unnamed protein product [Ascophyllum nodosum]